MGGKLGGLALLAAAGAKVYVVHKGMQLYHRYKAKQEGVGIGPAKFAALPRRKQAVILYYRRGRVKDFEVIYDRGRKRHGVGQGYFTP